MSTSEIFVTECIELALPPSTMEIREAMIFSSFLIQLFNKRHGVLRHLQVFYSFLSAVPETMQ